MSQPPRPHTPPPPPPSRQPQPPRGTPPTPLPDRAAECVQHSGGGGVCGVADAVAVIVDAALAVGTDAERRLPWHLAVDIRDAADAVEAAVNRIVSP